MFSSINYTVEWENEAGTYGPANRGLQLVTRGRSRLPQGVMPHPHIINRGGVGNLASNENPPVEPWEEEAARGPGYNNPDVLPSICRENLYNNITWITDFIYILCFVSLVTTFIISAPLRYFDFGRRSLSSCKVFFFPII